MYFVKKIYEITIKDYSIIEQSGRFEHLVKHLPAFLFIRTIKNRMNELSQLLSDGVNSEEDARQKAQWQLQAIAKINAIEINYLGVLNLLELGTHVTKYKPVLRREIRRKIRFSNNNLKTYIDNIYNFTGINIKNSLDIEKVRRELEFRKDKYNENYNRGTVKSQDKVYLMMVALGVFSYLNQPINENMTVVNFNILRKEAIKKMQKEKAK